eukprot:3146466-Pleurochrysis_carterae.AAC.1
MLAGTPYYLPASLAASKLCSYMAPGGHSLAPHRDASRWAMGARVTQPLLKPAFAHSLSSETSMAEERANARLRAALS